jgi:Outer membrane lipoprotein
MSDQRLERDDGSLLGRLLAAGDRDEPPPRAVRKTLLSLGLASTVSAAASSASATTTAAVVVKWLLVGAFAGASVSLAGGALLDRSEPKPGATLDRSPAALEHAPIQRNAMARAPTSRSLDDAPPAPPPVRPAAPVASFARARPATSATAPASPAPPPAASSAEPSDALLEQAAMIGRASNAVRAHDGARALEALRAYRARFPHGNMAPEAGVLEIEALLAAGQSEAARAAARRFLAAYPDSPSAKRVKTLVQIP